jgi:hypothetical protein
MTGILTQWSALLARRPALRQTLEPLTAIIGAWDAWSPEATPTLACTSGAAQDFWSRGDPLLMAGTPPLDRERIEPLLDRGLDVLGTFVDVQPFIDAWNGHAIEPADLLPVRTQFGSDALRRECPLTQEDAAFLAVAGLRPSLSVWFATSSALVASVAWDRGTCPCCGAPPAFAELLENGRRQLACHLCDARWTLARLACPFCDARSDRNLVRLIADGADEGYAITACRACGGYLKELDRRTRWNAGCAIVEDWGSPHLDLIAGRKGYWRPLATPVQLAVRPA